jgi:GTPase SAR1 family protein
MKVVVVGGSASNVGKTTLAARLIAEYAARGDTAAVKVTVHETPCATSVTVIETLDAAGRRHDTARLLAAGASRVVWVRVERADVRNGLALGLRAARLRRPATIVVESTSAGIELRRIHDSWFVAGEGEGKPWAERHRNRADHVVRSRDLIGGSGSGGRQVDVMTT